MDKFKKAEIEYFSKLSLEEKRWVKNKPFAFPKKSHELFRRFANIVQLLDPVPDLEILDLGTGSGWTTLFLAKFGCKVTGIDLSSDMTKIAQEKAKRERLNNVRFIVGDFEDTTLFNEGQFDAVLFFDALHHSANPQRSLNNCYKWLKPFGKILISEPNWEHKFRASTKMTTQKYGLKERGFTPTNLVRMLKRSGFKSVTQYYPSALAYSSSLKDCLKHISQPLVQRLLTKYFRTSLWILAYK